MKILDVVALLEAIPEMDLVKGEVGTIVEVLGQDSFEIEFSNKKGQTTNCLVLESKDFIS